MLTTLELRHSSLKILFRFSRWAKTSFLLSTAFPFCLLQLLSVSWPRWESLLLLLLSSPCRQMFSLSCVPAHFVLLWCRGLRQALVLYSLFSEKGIVPSARCTQLFILSRVRQD